MKKTFTLLIASLSIAIAQQAPTTKAEKVKLAYEIGVKAMNQGELEKAEKYLSAVVKAAPSHANAQIALTQLRDKKKQKISTQSKNLIDGVVIKKIELTEVPFNEALEDLAAIIDENNGENAAPNFAIIDPSNTLKDQLISLKLENIPAKAVLNYMVDAAQARAVYGEYIINIRKR